VRRRSAEEDLVDADLAVMDMALRQIEDPLVVGRREGLAMDDAVAEPRGIFGQGIENGRG
jgi:hypothetical protein